jgi:formamidopyrimidine-DNA glycosylase
LPPDVLSPQFTRERLRDFLARRRRTPVKALLLMQDIFPGVGNWMADEILWRARISPRRLCGKITAEQVDALWKEARAVCRESLATIGVDFSDPPEGWFFHVRWTKAGVCPRCGLQIKTATIGGRTTRWCAHCQK